MGVKERKEREFKRREEEILTAAYELLIDLEPIQMTMEMVAEKAEIGRGTIYKHFKSKDEIYGHLILQRRQNYIGTLNSLLKGRKDLVQKLIRSYMKYCTDDPVAFIVHQKCVNHYLESNLNETLVDLLRSQKRGKIALIERIMKKAFGDLSNDLPDIKYLIYAGWGMMSGAMTFLMENRVNGEELDDELFYEAAELIFLSGIPVAS